MFLDLLKQELGDSKSAGGEERFNCPFCGETNYKFYVHKEEGLWICFKCSETGNPLTFVTNYFSVDTAEAIDILAMYDYHLEDRDNYSLDQYGDDLSPEERLLLFISNEGQPPEAEVKIKYTSPAPPTNTKALASNFENPEAYPFFTYLHGRGVTLKQIKTHNISYVTHGQVTLVDGRQMDLVNHLVFYTFDDHNNPMYWNTRSIDPNPFVKSFNAPSKATEYSKNNTIFNLNNAKKSGRIVVNEGVFDAMTIGDSGVATFGKKITEKQIELLAEATNNTDIPIYLFLDPDAAKEMVKAAGDLQSKTNAPVYLIFNQTGQDANDLGSEACEELIANAIKADSEGQLIFEMLNL